MQQLFNYIYRFRVGLLLLWCSYLILLSFFYPMGGDETGYYYSARLFSRGEIPILDFFAIQPLGFFIPYAAIARWFSPSFEAMRLISLFSCIAVPLLITLLVNRYYGRTLAIYAFLIIAFSHWYFYWNIQIIHYSISNLSLFTSFFILFYFRPRVFLFFLAGFTMGWAINARLSLGPTGAVLFILIMTHIGQVQEVSWKERFLKRGLPFVFGGVLASLPTLAILIADSEAFLFNLLQARMKFRDDSIATILNPENLDFFQSFLKRRLAVIYHFFFWANSSPKSMIQNSFLLVVTSMIALIFFKRSKEERKTWRREIFQDTFISYLFWLGLVIFLSHFFTVMPTGYYVQYLFPIMTIILLGILFHGGIHSITPSIRDFDGWVFRTMAIFLVPYMFYHLAFSGINLIRRNTPNLGRLVTIAHVGCWIEQNSKANEALLGYVGTPIVATGRRLPQGFEYAAAVVPLFWWYNVDPKIAQRFKL